MNYWLRPNVIAACGTSRLSLVVLLQALQVKRVAAKRCNDRLGVIFVKQMLVAQFALMTKVLSKVFQSLSFKYVVRLKEFGLGEVKSAQYECEKV